MTTDNITNRHGRPRHSEEIISDLAEILIRNDECFLEGIPERRTHVEEIAHIVGRYAFGSGTFSHDVLAPYRRILRNSGYGEISSDDLSGDTRI